MKLQFTDQEIIADLRGSDSERRRLALEALFPGQTMSLIGAAPTGMSITTTSCSNPMLLFVSLLWASQQIGKLLRMELNWIGTQDPSQLVVAGEHALKVLK